MSSASDDDSSSLMPHAVFGDASLPVLVLVAGFPDNCTSGWGAKFIDDLKTTHFVVSLCFPGFDSPKSNRPWGYTFAPLVQMMHRTIRTVLDQHGVKDNQRYDLMVHDWGSYLGQLYENTYPEQIRKVVMIDAGNMRGVPFSIHLAYRPLFGLSYWVSQNFGHTLGTISFRLSLILMVLLPFIGPIMKEKTPRTVTEIDVDMCYPFYYTVILPMFGVVQPRPTVCAAPILFLYGLKKRCPLHGPFFLDELDKKTGSQHVSLERSGHWPMHSDTTTVLREVRAFLAN